MKPYVVVYKTKAGYVSAWSEHDSRTEAREVAAQRAEKTGRPHHVAEVVSSVEMIAVEAR